MPLVDRLYDWLARGPTPDCDEILGAALERAEPPYFERIVAQLLQRRNAAAWAALAGSYQQLTAEIRQRLGADTNLLRGGLAMALGSPSAAARCNALAALRDWPLPALVYLLPDLLRDVSEDVRKAAVPTLRRIAEAVVDEVPTPEWSDDRRRGHATARAEVTKALRAAVHTFDRHHRIEAVELTLWFASDLGSELWQQLSNPRSLFANTVSRHLDSWNNPHLARFLLDSLGQSGWRRYAVDLLPKWHELPEVSAILRHNDLLSDPDVCRRLGGLKQAQWFRELRGRNLERLPGELRAAAPRWACYVGLPETEKIALLSEWMATDDPLVQQACVYALAALGTPMALGLLSEVAQSQSPFAQFARWYVVGKRSGAPASGTRSADKARRAQAPSGESGTSAQTPPEHRGRAGPATPPAGAAPGRVFADQARAEMPGVGRTAAVPSSVPDAARKEAPHSTPDPNTARLQQELRQAMARLLAEDQDPAAVGDLLKQIRSLARQLPGSLGEIAGSADRNLETRE